MKSARIKKRQVASGKNTHTAETLCVTRWTHQKWIQPGMEDNYLLLLPLLLKIEALLLSLPWLGITKLTNTPLWNHWLMKSEQKSILRFWRIWPHVKSWKCTERLLAIIIHKQLQRMNALDREQVVSSSGLFSYSCFPLYMTGKP